LGGVHAQSVVHLDLNFILVLFLTTIVRSERIFSLSRRRRISKLGEAVFNQDRKNMILGNDKEMVQGIKTT